MYVFNLGKILGKFFINKWRIFFKYVIFYFIVCDKGIRLCFFNRSLENVYLIKKSCCFEEILKID